MLFSTNFHFAGVKYKSGDSRPTSGDCMCDNHNKCVTTIPKCVVEF